MGLWMQSFNAGVQIKKKQMYDNRRVSNSFMRDLILIIVFIVMIGLIAASCYFLKLYLDEVYPAPMLATKTKEQLTDNVLRQRSDKLHNGLIHLSGGSTSNLKNDIPKQYKRFNALRKALSVEPMPLNVSSKIPITSKLTIPAPGTSDDLASYTPGSIDRPMHTDRPLIRPTGVVCTFGFMGTVPEIAPGAYRSEAATVPCAAEFKTAILDYEIINLAGNSFTYFGIGLIDGLGDRKSPLILTSGLSTNFLSKTATILGEKDITKYMRDIKDSAGMYADFLMSDSNAGFSFTGTITLYAEENNKDKKTHELNRNPGDQLIHLSNQLNSWVAIFLDVPHTIPVIFPINMERLHLEVTFKNLDFYAFIYLKKRYFELKIDDVIYATRALESVIDPGFECDLMWGATNAPGSVAVRNVIIDLSFLAGKLGGSHSVTFAIINADRTEPSNGIPFITIGNGVFHVHTREGVLETVGDITDYQVVIPTLDGPAVESETIDYSTIISGNVQSATGDPNNIDITVEQRVRTSMVQTVSLADPLRTVEHNANITNIELVEYKSGSVTIEKTKDVTHYNISANIEDTFYVFPEYPLGWDRRLRGFILLSRLFDSKDDNPGNLNNYIVIESGKADTDTLYSIPDPSGDVLTRFYQQGTTNECYRYDNLDRSSETIYSFIKRWSSATLELISSSSPTDEFECVHQAPTLDTEPPVDPPVDPPTGPNQLPMKLAYCFIVFIAFLCAIIIGYVRSAEHRDCV